MNLIAFTVINKDVESGVIQISALFDTIYLLFVKRSSETRLFRHLPDNVFGIRNFGNTSALRVFFFWKCSKLYLQCKNTENNSENVFPFRDKCIWVWCVKLPLLTREYFWPAVNVSKNSPEVYPITTRDVFEFNYLYSDQQIW